MPEKWVQAINKTIDINVCVIIKKRQNSSNKRWEYTELDSFIGEWNDLVYELYKSYNQFAEEVNHYTKKRELHNKLDEIAKKLEARGMPYEFVLPDFTDSWYVAYIKTVTFRLDTRGELR